MLDLIKITYRSLRDGHIGKHRIDNRPIKWVGFILWVPPALVLYAVFMGIFWVAYVLLILPLMLLGQYLFDRKEATFEGQGIQFTKAYGRCLIPWEEVREVVYQREPTIACYRVIRTGPDMKTKKYTIASIPEHQRFEAVLQERHIPFRRINWLNEPIQAEPDALDPDVGT